MPSHGHWPWVSTATVTALALATAVPLVYYKLRQSAEDADRQEALKLLRRVELIVGEVSVRLMHVGNQVEDLIANQERGTPEENAATLSSYYHFDSQGNKLKTKWDSYNVDAELEKMDQEDQEDRDEDSARLEQSVAPAQSRARPAMSKSKLQTALGGIEHEFEAVLEFLDGIRGDEHVKAARKALVTRITKQHFVRIDALRAMIQ